MKTRFDYMTPAEQARWKAFERMAGRELPRTHEYCMLILGRARPGKTKKDKKGH